MRDGSLLAAVDLGSNSYRLEIGRCEHGQVVRAESLKETVRQGAGLDEARRLTPEAMQRGWDCLARFAERLAGFAPAQVRAVATQTLREARNRAEFLQRAQRILGFPIDVISGAEEARLIYLGVAHLLPDSAEQRLVVDIGGRSTELVLGRGLDAQVMESCPVGSVDSSMTHFAGGRFTPQAFQAAEIAAKAVLEEAADRFRRDACDVAYGASGTIGAIGEILAAAGWPAGQVSAAGLQWLREQLCAARSAERVRLDGLRDDRRAVIGGGLSVLRGVFDVLQVQAMNVAEGALRHGLLHDLVEREHGGPDLRSASVQRLARKFAVDPEQARRVAHVALALSRQLREGAAAPDDAQQERPLAWAAQLHEIGSLVSHDGYPKHGAYILDNADVLGFSQPELHRLGLLVLGHRGKLRKLEAALQDPGFAQQLLCLRLAVIFCHARRDADVEGVRLQRTGKGFLLELPPGWARAWPQSAHLLRAEAQAWQKAAGAPQLRVPEDSAPEA